MKSLLIVESATKSKTIKKYLNDPNINVTFSCGHIFNLPKDKLGINTEDWTMEQVPINIKIINNIQKMAKECDTIYLASDPDLEGEAIAYSLQHLFKNNLNKKCLRVTFNEITKKALQNAVHNPRKIDLDKVYAQETRRIVDRLIGYKISPILWSHFDCNYLSAGRVQFAALILCINQRKKILDKEIIAHWTIRGTFKAQDIKLDASLYDDDFIWKTYDSCIAKETLKDFKIGQVYNVSYNQKNRKCSPPPPYTTTTMQQDAYNKLRYSAKYTMKIAQDLYENGLITYMRTDSVGISNDAKNMILHYIKNKYGDDYGYFRTYKTKIINAQEAHEAIRITDPNKQSIENNFEGCTDKHVKLYDIIWKRSIASLMIDAEYIDLQISFSNNKSFLSTKSFLIKEGYLVVYDTKNEISDLKDVLKYLDEEHFSLHKIISEGNIDNVPSMYNEVQLIKELEKEGIGRPSTYASIIDKLLSKKYVELGQNPQQTIDIESYEKKNNDNAKIAVKNKQINLGGKQKDLLIPTEIGIDVIQYIFNIAPYLCDLKFTAKMEDDLDAIIHNSTSKEIILNTLYSKICNTITMHSSVPVKTPSKKNDSSDKEIIKTRYGWCYHDKITNKYTNIESFLSWKKINAEQLSEKDIQFIKSLPKMIEKDGKKFHLYIGKYGLYLKDMSDNNVKLEKKLWHTFIYTLEDLK